MRHTAIVIAHGGEWSEKESSYIGFERELIPIPPGGPIGYRDLLSKIELRIMKPRSKYAYKVVALVKSPTSDTIRMKITDDFEVGYVLDQLETPILYISTTPINDELLEIVNDQAARVTNGTKQLTMASRKAFLDRDSDRNSDTNRDLDRDLDRNLDTNLNRDLDGNLDMDRDRGMDRDLDRNLDTGMDRDLDRNLDRGTDRHFDWNSDWGFDDRDLDREDDHDPFVASGDREEDDVDSLENIPCTSIRRTVTSVGSRNVAFEGDHEYVGQWIIPGASFHMKEPKTQDNLGNEGIGDDTLCKAAIFSSKEKLTTVLGLYHLANHVSFSTPRSCSKRYHVVCKNREATACSFVLRAQALGNAWEIIEWSPHICEKDLRFHAEPNISSRVLGAYFVPNLMTKGVVLRPSDVIAMIKRKFGATLQYQTALAARNHALTMVYGDANKSFQLIPKYLWMLAHSNPGSFTALKVNEDDGNFKYCFMALAACVRGFKACRPVIVVDGTHLKGKYKGILFVAVTKDANEQILPLAFALGDVECDESWTWFFQQLRRAFGCPENMLIVSDQHVSIKNALDLVYPGVAHGLCVYHLQKNIKYWGDHAIALFQQAVHAYRARDFDQAMTNLKAHAPAAYTKVMDVDPIKWARSKCPVRRYLFSTSNAAECLNGCLRWARTLPVCTLLECIRSLVGQWFVERRAIATSRTHELTDFGQSKLGRASELGSTMSVEAISLTKFKVSTAMKHHVVDLERKQCTCLIFDLDLIPCSHAAAALRHTKQSAIPFVSRYYSTEALRENYAGEVLPIPIPEEWDVPATVQSQLVGTPNNPRQAGRPRLSRMRSASESSSQSRTMARCTRCRQFGHYQNSCDVPIPISSGDVSSSNSKRRKPKSCSVCRVVGHTRLTCKYRAPPQ